MQKLFFNSLSCYFNKLILFIFLLYFQIASSFDNSCYEVFQFLFKTIGFEKIINDNIYNLYGTGGITVRSVATMPINLYYNSSDALFNNFSINLFFLAIPDGVVFGDNKRVSAVINTKKITDFYNKNLVDFFSQSPFISMNVPFFSECFDYISIIQKRLGFLLQGGYEINNSINIYCQLPFVYQILYPSVPSELQGVISMEVAQIGFNPNKEINSSLVSVKTSRDVIMQHSVCDSFGLDRSILGIMKKWYNESIITEFRILLPGKDIISNQRGGNFSLAFQALPPSNLEKKFITFFETNEINSFDGIIDRFLVGIDRVVLGSYYSPLANQPLGISPSLIVSVPCGNKFFVDGYATYIYNFSQNRKGCVMSQEFFMSDEMINQYSNKKKSCQLLKLFAQELEHKVIPLVINGTFYSGAECQISLALRSTITDMNLSIGADWWYKEKSSFVTNATQITMKPLSNAFQLNGFVNFEYFTEMCGRLITIGGIAQSTLYGHGIGNEYGAKIQITVQY